MNLGPLAALADQAYDLCLKSPPNPYCEKGNDEDPPIEDCNACLRDSYFSESEDAISYACPRKRWLYVLRYLPTTAYDSYLALSYANDWWDAITMEARTQKELRVVSLGCGPGSDLVGALMWLSERKISADAEAGLLSHDTTDTTVRLIGLDSEQAWEPVFQHVITSVGRDYAHRLHSLRIQHGMYPADTVAPSVRELQPHVLLCSWVWSELESDEEAVRLWNDISVELGLLPHSCFVGFLDRTENRIVRRLDDLISNTSASSLVLKRADENVYHMPIHFSQRTGCLFPRRTMKSAWRLMLVNTAPVRQAA